jgi:hypothetical protein
MPPGPGPLGASPQGQMSAPQPPPGPPGGDALSALLGGAGPMAGAADPGSIMQLFSQLEMQVTDLARALPGTEQLADQVMQILQMWKTQAVVAMAPPPAQMPGAPAML